MWHRFTRLTFRASCLRLGNFRTLSSREVEKSLNWSAVCAALHCGPLETAPLEGFDPPGAATALLLTVEFVLVSTVVVFPWVRNLSEPPPHLLSHGVTERKTLNLGNIIPSTKGSLPNQEEGRWNVSKDGTERKTCRFTFARSIKLGRPSFLLSFKVR